MAAEPTAERRPARGRRDLRRGDRSGSAARTRTPPPPTRGPPARPGSSARADDDEQAAHRLYDLALEFQERSQRSEARLLEQFEGMSAGLVVGHRRPVIVDDDDERLS